MKLYALFTAINAYQGQIVLDRTATFPPLSGCISDVQAIEEWLKLDGSFELHPVHLFDAQATKANVVDAIRTHLSKASAQDAVLWYFAGHGSVEVADQSVWGAAESDGRLEGIVCHYDSNHAADCLLVDKEIRFLLHELSQKTGAHITTIFDCCHSGDNTRALTEDATLVKRQVDIVFPQRKWAEFVFADRLQAAEVQQRGIETVLPEGNYLQIAACESNEPATEGMINGRRHGILTGFLLKVLRDTGGHVTYGDLVRRIRNQIRFRYTQQPHIYTPAHFSAQAQQGFLGKNPDQSAAQGQIDYVPAKGEYWLNRGILDRIGSDTVVEGLGLDQQWYPAVVVQRSLERTQVDFSPTVLHLIDTGALKARVQNLEQYRLRLRPLLGDLPLAQVQQWANDISAQVAVDWTDRADEADYDWVTIGGMHYLCLPDAPKQPVSAAILPQQPLVTELVSLLRHLGRWHQIFALQNTLATDTLTKEALKVEFFDAQGQVLSVQDGRVTLPLLQQGADPSWQNGFKIKLTNQLPHKVYVAMLYMSDYGSNDALFLAPNTATLLESGEGKWTYRQDRQHLLRLGLDDTARLFGLKGTHNWIKIVVSTERFDTDSLQLSALPSAAETGADTLRGSIVDDSLRDTKAPAPLKGWTTLLYDLYVPNPLHGQVIDTQGLNSFLTQLLDSVAR
jgi:Caspase domain